MVHNIIVSKIDNTLTPSVNYYRDKVRLRFRGSVLQQKTVTYSHKKVVNFYVVYEITNFHEMEIYATLAKTTIPHWQMHYLELLN